MLSSVALIKPYKNINPWFITYVLRSDVLQKMMKGQSKGSALRRIVLAQINEFLIPLPPLSEQKRIVAKLDAILPYLSFEDKAVEE